MKTTPTDPAFPTKREALDPRATGWMMQEGMNLRTYIAAKIMAAYSGHPEYGIKSANDRAEWSVQDADALIAELNKEPK